MIKDRYFRKKGSTAKIINVKCLNCKERLLIYQKDGSGWLKRCYFNRILWPKKYSKLKTNKMSNVKDLISVCGKIIGRQIIHKDGRAAFQLIRGSFKRSNNNKKEWQ